VVQLGEGAAPKKVDSNEPPQPWLRKPVVKEFMPGKPLKSVGYPKQKALRSPESESLHGGAKAEIEQMKNEGKWQAIRHPYPGGGKMNAADIKNTIGEIAPLVAIAEKGALADRQLELERSKLHASRMQRLAASLKEGAQGKRLLSGALMQQQGILQGNLGNCRRHLLTCKQAEEVQELGESDDLPPAPWRNPTETAREEDARKNGELIPGVQTVKGKRPAQQEEHTATQDYARAQSGGFWDSLPHPPGMKMTHDRLPAKHLNTMLLQARTMIDTVKRLNAREDAEGAKRVELANRKALEAQKSIAKANEDLRKMEKPVPAAVVLQHMKQIGAELKTCMAKVLQICGSQPFQAAYPASTVKAVLNQLPNPRDAQSYKPDPLAPKKGPGGDKPITPGK